MWGAASRVKERVGGASARRQLDKELKEATGDENYGVPNSLLQKIAQATEDEEDCQRVLNHIWETLREKSDKRWRRVQKALTLLEACMKFGSDSCIQTVQHELWQVKKWQDHKVIEGGKDQGGGIRLKAETIVDLATDPQRLQQERQKAAALAGKMTAVAAPEEPKKESRLKSGISSAADKARNAGSAFRRGGGEKSGLEDGGSPDNGFGSAPSASQKADQIDAFCRLTGCTSKATAEQYLQRAGWDANLAIGMYIPDTQGFGGGGARRQPSESEKKKLVEQVMGITKASERQASSLLEQCQWSADLAIEKFFQQGGGPTARAESSSSGSDSSSSSDSDDAPAAKGKGKGGFGGPAPGGFGAPGGGFGAPAGPGGFGAPPQAGRGGKGAAAPPGGPGGGFGAPPGAGRGGFGGGAAPFGGPPGGGAPGGFGRGSAQRSSSAGPSYPPAGGAAPFGGGGGQANPFGGGKGGAPAGRGGPFGGGGGFGGKGGGGGFGAPPAGGGGFGAPAGGGFGAPAGRGGGGGFGAPPPSGGFGGGQPNPFGGGGAGRGGGGFGGGGGGGFGGGGWPS